jgi:hypothetical protein
MYFVYIVPHVHHRGSTHVYILYVVPTRTSYTWYPHIHRIQIRSTHTYIVYVVFMGSIDRLSLLFERSCMGTMYIGYHASTRKHVLISLRVLDALAQ